MRDGHVVGPVEAYVQQVDRKALRLAHLPARGAERAAEGAVQVASGQREGGRLDAVGRLDQSRDLPVGRDDHGVVGQLRGLTPRRAATHRHESSPASRAGARPDLRRRGDDAARARRRRPRGAAAVVDADRPSPPS